MGDACEKGIHSDGLLACAQKGSRRMFKLLISIFIKTVRCISRLGSICRRGQIIYVKWWASLDSSEPKFGAQEETCSRERGKKANFSSRRIRIFFDGNELSEFFNFSIELCVVFFTLLFSEVSRERAVFVQRVPLCSLVELKEPSKICQNAVEEFFLPFLSFDSSSLSLLGRQ